MNALWHDADPRSPWRGAWGTVRSKGRTPTSREHFSNGCCCVGSGELSNVNAYRRFVDEVFGQANARLPNGSPPSVRRSKSVIAVHCATSGGSLPRPVPSRRNAGDGVLNRGATVRSLSSCIRHCHTHAVPGAGVILVPREAQAQRGVIVLARGDDKQRDTVAGVARLSDQSLQGFDRVVEVAGVSLERGTYGASSWIRSSG